MPSAIPVTIEPLSHPEKTPENSFFSDKQQRLLVSSLYSAFCPPMPFLATAKVTLLYAVRRSPLVPDVMVSLDVKMPQDWSQRENRSYLVWEMGKSPDVAIEIITNRDSQASAPQTQLDQKLQDYARAGIGYYVVFDPLQQRSDQPLRVYESRGNHYILQESAWMEQVNLGLTLWEGEFEDKQDTWLRWCDRDNQLLLTGGEQAEAERRRAETAEEKVKQLEQRLQAKGIKLDERPQTSSPSPPLVQTRTPTTSSEEPTLSPAPDNQVLTPPEPVAQHKEQSATVAEDSMVAILPETVNSNSFTLEGKVATANSVLTSPPKPKTEEQPTETVPKPTPQFPSLLKKVSSLSKSLPSWRKLLPIILPLSVGIVTGVLVLWPRSFKDPKTPSSQKTETSVPPDPIPQLRDVSQETPDWSWEQKVRHLIDRQTLSQAFAQADYRLPKGSYVYAARILPNRVGGLAYVFYEAGQGAFSEDFWPASTVKVLAALGALDFAADQGFSGQATVTFKSQRGKTLFSDRLQEIYKRAIRVSSNADYDRTLQIAGLDRQ